MSVSVEQSISNDLLLKAIYSGGDALFRFEDQPSDFEALVEPRLPLRDLEGDCCGDYLGETGNRRDREGHDDADEPS